MTILKEKEDNIVTFETEDLPESDDNPLEWKEVDFLTSGENHGSILKKISAMFRNIRYLYKGVTEFNGKLSHIGMIIHSTTLDTMEKVIAIYGGIKWERIEDRFLLGASDTYPIGTLGGETEVVLTTNQMPKHTHGMPHGYQGTTPSEINISFANSMKTGTYQLTTSTGDNQPHNNMPPYKAVYIWERTA